MNAHAALNTGISFRTSINEAQLSSVPFIFMYFVFLSVIFHPVLNAASLSCVRTYFFDIHWWGYMELV
jgi:hypothetical protein